MYDFGPQNRTDMERYTDFTGVTYDVSLSAHQWTRIQELLGIDQYIPEEEILEYFGIEKPMLQSPAEWRMWEQRMNEMRKKYVLNKLELNSALEEIYGQARKG